MSILLLLIISSIESPLSNKITTHLIFTPIFIRAFKIDFKVPPVLRTSSTKIIFSPLLNPFKNNFVFD